MTPTPDPYIVKTSGSCEELSENHAQGLVIALRMGDTIEHGLEEIRTMLGGVKKEVSAMAKDIKDISRRMDRIENWQDAHDLRIKREAERWGPVKQTAIQTTVRWAVGGILLFLGSALGAGFVLLARVRLGL